MPRAPRTCRIRSHDHQLKKGSGIYSKFFRPASRYVEPSLSGGPPSATEFSLYRRLRLLLFGAYAVVALLYAGLLLVFTYAERDAALRDARAHTAYLAVALEQDISRSLGNAELLLRDLADWIDEHGGPERVDRAALQARLVQRVGRVSDVRALFLYGADLILSASSLDVNSPRLEGWSRDYVAVHEDGAVRDLFIGRAMSGPISGDNVVPVTLRLTARDGRFVGVIGASLDLAHFDRFYRSLELANDANVSVVRADGSVLFRFPAERFSAGETLSDTGLFIEPLKSQGAGTLEMRLPSENALRIVSYRRDEKHPLVFTVSREKDAVLAPWRRNLVQRTALLAFLLLLGGLLVRMLLGEAKTRAAAQAALRAGEQRFASFFHALPLAAVISRFADGRIIEVNAEWLRTFGYTRDRVVGRRAVELGILDSTQRNEALETLDSDSGLVVTEMPMRRSSGETADVRMHAVGLELEGERCVLGLLEDVTERKRAEETRRRTEEQLAKLFRSSPAPHAIVRLEDGRHAELNDAWIRMFGFSREEAIGRTAVDMGVWPSAEGRAQFARLLAETGRLPGYSAQLRRKDGVLLDVMISAEVIDLDGVPHALVSVTDLSAERRAEEKLAAFFRSSPVAHVITDLEDGRMVEVNEAYERMFGVTRAEAIGKTGNELGLWRHAEERDRFIELFERTGRVVDFPSVRSRRNGELFHVRVSAETIDVAERRYRMTSIQDITAEQTAREAMDRLAGFFRSSPIAHAIVRFDDGRHVEINEAWLRTFGFSRDEAIGRTATDMGLWQNAAERARFAQTLAHSGRVLGYSALMRRRDGALFETLLSGEVIELQGVPHMLTSVADVSIERRAQEAARRSAEQLARFFRSSPAAHVIIRLDDYHHVEVNDAWSRIFGFSRDEVVGRTAAELGLFPDLAQRARFLEEVQATGRMDHYPVKIRRKNGELLDIRLSAEVIELEGERHLLVSSEDVTAETAAREALKRSEERFATLFRSSPIPVALLQLPEGRYVEVNQSFETAFGRRRSEILGRTAVETGIWIRPADRERLVEEIMARGRVRGREVRFRHHSGAELDCRVWAELVDIHGVPHILSSTVDVTEQKRAQDEIRRLNEGLEQRVRTRTAELEAANRELESFSYSVSHDLRAPIRAILGFAEILRAEHAGRLEGDAQRLLERIARAAGHMGELIDALLQLSRLMRRPLTREQIDLSRIARAVLDELRERAPERHVEIVVQPGLAALADPVLMRSVLQNLLGNAWKYTSHTAAARIEVGRADEAFYVRDNGAGFEMRYVDRLFKPFERLHRAEEFPGTGIGLATVDRIMRRHGGRVWAEGALGAGATFYFTLPN